MSYSIRERVELYTRRMKSAFYGLLTVTGIGFVSWIIMIISGLVFGPDYEKVGYSPASTGDALTKYKEFAWLTGKTDGSAITTNDVIAKHFSEFSWGSLARFSIFFFVLPALFCLGAYLYYLIQYNKTVEVAIANNIAIEDVGDSEDGETASEGENA